MNKEKKFYKAVWIEPETHKLAKVLAAQNNWTMDKLLEMLIKNYQIAKQK